jgi:hypothetical protein
VSCGPSVRNDLSFCNVEACDMEYSVVGRFMDTLVRWGCRIGWAVSGVTIGYHGYIVIILCVTMAYVLFVRWGGVRLARIHAC